MMCFFPQSEITSWKAKEISSDTFNFLSKQMAFLTSQSDSRWSNQMTSRLLFPPQAHQPRKVATPYIMHRGPNRRPKFPRGDSAQWRGQTVQCTILWFVGWGEGVLWPQKWKSEFPRFPGSNHWEALTMAQCSPFREFRHNMSLLKKPSSFLWQGQGGAHWRNYLWRPAKTKALRPESPDCFFHAGQNQKHKM